METTWRNWVADLEKLDNGQLEVLSKALKDRKSPLFCTVQYGAKTDLWNGWRALDFAIIYVTFTRSHRWDRESQQMTTEPHTQRCIDYQASLLDDDETYFRALTEYRVLWGDTFCEKCRGWGMVGGSAGDYWTPPEPAEPCENCLAAAVTRCPRCARSGILMLDDDGWPTDETKCKACGWTPGTGGEPVPSGAYGECICGDR